MTGQLFVVPAETPVDPYVRLVLELADGRELRFRDIRKFGRIGLYGRDPVTGELVTEVGGTGVFAPFGPEPLDPAFTVRDFRRSLRRRKGRLKPLLLDQSFLAGVGNIYADEALWAARLHPLRTAGTLRPADERRLYEALRTILAEAVERRGSSIDDYTAPDGDGSMQEHLQVYQRTGEPCPRCGRPIKRIVVGARSTHFCSWCQRLQRGRPEGCRGDPADDDRRAAPGRPPLDRAGRGGDARADARRKRPGLRRRSGPSERSGPRPPAARPRGRRRRRAATRTRPMSILRLTGVTREVGTFVILDAIDASIALGDRIGLVGPNGAGKTTLLRLASGRDEPDRGEVHRKRGLTLGLLAQEAHFDEAFMASPDLRLAVRTGAAHLDRMAERLAAMERDGPRHRAGLRRAPPPVRGPRRLHARPAGRERADRSRLHARRVGQAAVRAVRRRADAGVAGPPGHRRSGPAAARRAHQPPRPRRARMARGAPPSAERLAARRVPRPGVPRRHGGPRLGAPRPAPDRVPRRLQRLPPPARRARRAGRQGRRHPGRADRAREGARPALPEPPQVQQDARARGAAREARGGTPRRARRPAGSWPSRRAALVGGAGPSRSGEIVVRVEDLAVGYLPGRGAIAAGRRARDRAAGRGAGAVPGRPARRADRHRRSERGRQDDAAADDRRRPAAARRVDHLRQRRPDRLPRPAPERGDRRARPSSMP